ncbi:Adenylate cyclase [Labilithrix luteola]|uniref:Adenylate cyclase n=1 Tax=Labilithrix luteola TaxID=1391654 RepID=A0A0K1Q2W2_9BACT|nr:adenylate/guanylate cyclase domain-containing protein [Labilithrix luteola]AKV00073.1 Adenylate cyclase [Labilithrix luteola]
MSRASILATAERARMETARQVEHDVDAEFERARRALEDVEHGIASGAIGVDRPSAIEPALFTRVLVDPHLEEVTFTHAALVGYDPTGNAVLAPESRWQVAVFRTGASDVDTRLTQKEGEGFVSRVRTRPARPEGPERIRFAAPLHTAGAAADPTDHPTFTVLATRERRGRAIWSDLHYSELDQALPTSERRVIVSLQKAVEDESGRFVGVLRVGLLTNELDAITHLGADGGPREGHRIVLLAVDTDDDSKQVHLVARVTPNDHLATFDDSLRVVSDRPPPDVDALLASPLVASLDPDHPNGSGTLMVDGEPYLATLHELPLGSGGTSGWFTAILAPESYYTHDLVRFERASIVGFGAALALVLAIGVVTIGAVRRGLGRVVATTTRMRQFDFAPSNDASALRDVDEVMKALERAKTVVRAMGKYVPVDLVRRLYVANREPELGGELLEVSLMFTDIQGFTSLSETLSPDELARRLGDYLDAMSEAIESTGGTIDKYIGDAVMAIWNAPTPVAGHERQACRAALACMDAVQKLYASRRWGLPPLVTRFGIHKARVMVGHFGAHSRLSYTALGDGVNLAARLEPLCKQYGVVMLASEEIVEEAKDAFVFRRLDRVAVKGKTRATDVYELLGRVGDDIPKRQLARRYEQAFEVYLARDFATAIELLAPQEALDPPSAVLAERCRYLREHPPPEGWDGVHVAPSK